MKGELWTSVIRAALLEAGALVVRAEARCPQSQIEALRRQLAKVLERTPSPFGVPGAELHAVADASARRLLRPRGCVTDWIRVRVAGLKGERLPAAAPAFRSAADRGP